MHSNVMPYVFPGYIREDILSLGNYQIPYMRTQQFSDVVLDCQSKLLDLIGSNQGRVIFGTCSGTAAMEAIVVNYVATKKRPAVIDSGSFGHRWSELCKYHNIDHNVFKVDFGCDIKYDDLEKFLLENNNDVILYQHHETSSGQLHDINKIAQICKKNSIKQVVDVISSFLVEDLNLDELQIDIAVTSSQKGLNIPAGLALVFLNKSILNEPFAHNNYYLDFNENLTNLLRGQTPFSPATTLFYQLQKRLDLINSEGLETHKKNVRENALAFRKKCDEFKWVMPCQTPSYAVTGFFVAGDVNKLVKRLVEQNIFIMPGGKPGYLRVSHTGDTRVADYLNVADAIHELLITK